MSRRDKIKLSEEEVLAFSARSASSPARPTACAASHLMPLWFVVRDGTIWAWTFAKSQKVRNLERDPRATLQWRPA